MLAQGSASIMGSSTPSLLLPLSAVAVVSFAFGATVVGFVINKNKNEYESSINTEQQCDRGAKTHQINQTTVSSNDVATTDVLSANTSSGIISTSIMKQTTATAPQIRLVVQRFRQASLLVPQEEDAAMMVPIGHDESRHVGVLVYISFSETATLVKIKQASKIVLNLPVLTRGTWGDGNQTQSVLELAQEQQQPQEFGDSSQRSDVSVVIVPQANLISKVKNAGKSIQYHAQIDKEQGRLLYNEFVQTVQAEVLQHQYKFRNEAVPDLVTNVFQKKSNTLDASIPPHEMFRQGDTLYDSWDDKGIPLTKGPNKEPVTKSARKKLSKQYEAQRKRHDKFRMNQNRLEETTSKSKEKQPSLSSLLDPHFIHVVSGIFGNLQALEMRSDMGPFCHVVDI